MLSLVATLVVMSSNAAKAQTHANPPRVIFESLPFATLLDMRHPISESGWTRVVLPLCPPATSNNLITTERFPLWLIINRMWVGGVDFVRASDRDCHSAPRDAALKSQRNSDSPRHATAISAAISVSATSAMVTERIRVHHSAAANAIDSINVASSSLARTGCGIVGADARPHWKERAEQERLTGLHGR
jgi:hypothetical protein